MRLCDLPCSDSLASIRSHLFLSVKNNYAVLNAEMMMSAAVVETSADVKPKVVFIYANDTDYRKVAPGAAEETNIPVDLWKEGE